jgi:hypothetical protein
MKKGIFYNSKKTQCSIYESGIMCYNALKKSNKYTLEYSDNCYNGEKYDFAIFNHHILVNNWMNESIIKKINCKTFCIVLEVGEHENLMPQTIKIFDHYMIIDPTIKESNNIHAFPRPLEDYEIIKYENEIPIIGSFGFVTSGKNWHCIIQQVNEEFDQAIIKINLPYATYVSNSKHITEKLTNELFSIEKKKNIILEITHEYMDKKELINWCSKNTINFFPYYRNMDGLAAVTDQAIVAEKPILVTKNKTFRHILKYLKPFPEINIKEAIKINKEGVLKMKNDWSSDNFFKKFEILLLR